jgi:hypothetical protein
MVTCLTAQPHTRDGNAVNNNARSKNLIFSKNYLPYIGMQMLSLDVNATTAGKE